MENNANTTQVVRFDYKQVLVMQPYSVVILDSEGNMMFDTSKVDINVPKFDKIEVLVPAVSY